MARKLMRERQGREEQVAWRFSKSFTPIPGVRMAGSYGQ